TPNTLLFHLRFAADVSKTGENFGPDLPHYSPGSSASQWLPPSEFQQLKGTYTLWARLPRRRRPAHYQPVLSFALSLERQDSAVSCQTAAVGPRKSQVGEPR